MDTKKLRQKILDLAIHGKLVPQDPNDEPASVLLERIKAEKEQLIKEGKIKRQKKSASSDTSHYGNNVPFEVPKGWVWCNMTEITDKITDGTHHSPTSYPKGDYMYITAKNIKDSGVALDNMTFVTSEVFQEVFSRCNPEKGDILYVKDGATTGVVTINDIDDPFCLLSSVALIKPSKSINSRYLLYYLKSSICYSSVRESMKGVGITRITLKQIESWNIPIPPLSEQKRIVDEVERWFTKIDAIEQSKCDLNSVVQKTKNKILDLALSGKLTSDTSHYGKNEETFSGAALGDVCKLCDGEKIAGKDYTNLDVKYLRGTKSGDMLHSGRFVPAGSLMILVDGENSGEVFTTPVDGYQGSTFKILDIDAKYCKEFILLLIQSNRKSLRENKVGSAIPHLNKKMFKEIVVPPFSYNEQCEIAQTVKDYFCVLDSIVG